MREAERRGELKTPEKQASELDAFKETPPARTISVGPVGSDQVVTTGDENSKLDLQLGFVFISHMHQQFFRTDEALSALYAAMNRHVKDKVTVVVSYRSKSHRGWVRAELAQSALKKEVGSVETGLVVDVLTPLTVALSDYRNWVWTNRDLRIANFNVALVLKSGKAECRFTVTGDVFPLDGSELSPCVETAGQEFCGEITDGVLRFPADAQGALAPCFAL